MAFLDNIKQVSVPFSQVKTYTPAVKVGNKILAAGIGGDFIPGNFIGQPYVVVSDSGQLKVQKLAFDQTTPQDIGQIQTLGEVKIFQTGHPQPEGEQGPSMSFYKCTSVNTSNNTWSGKEAILNDGAYKFDSQPTTGLTYTSITPTVNGIYSQDALITVKSMYDGMPVNGLVFYAPFSEVKSAAETGQTLNSYGSPAYQTFKGIPSVHLPSGVYITSSLANATSMPAFTMAVWRLETPDSGTGYHVGITDNDDYRQFILGGNTLYYDSGQYITNMNGQRNVWYFEASVWDGSTLKHYRDLTLKGQNAISSEVLRGNYIVCGTDFTNGYYSHSDIYLAGFRIYNRALSMSQLTTLYSQFTPTA